MEQKLKELKGEKYKSKIIITGDFDTPLSVIYTISLQNISKDIQDKQYYQPI